MHLGRLAQRPPACLGPPGLLLGPPQHRVHAGTEVPATAPAASSSAVAALYSAVAAYSSSSSAAALSSAVAASSSSSSSAAALSSAVVATAAKSRLCPPLPGLQVQVHLGAQALHGGCTGEGRNRGGEARNCGNGWLAGPSGYLRSGGTRQRLHREGVEGRGVLRIWMAWTQALYGGCAGRERREWGGAERRLHRAWGAGGLGSPKVAVDVVEAAQQVCRM